MKIAYYFQRFHDKFDGAFHKLCVANFADIHSLSRFRDYCKTSISGLIDKCQYNDDVIKFLEDFATDFKKSRLFTLMSDEEVEIDCQKVELLVSIESLKKVCGYISSVFTAVSNVPSIWYNDMQVLKIIASKTREATRQLNEWPVASFFKAECSKLVK